MATGGDIVEITCNHPTLGSFTLFPKAGESSTYDLGGFRSEDDDAGLDGGGNMVDKMTRKRWFFEVVVAWDMNVKEDLEKCVAAAESPLQADWTFTHMNGVVYGAKGKPVGDLAGAGDAATFPLKVSGGGKATKLVG